MPAPLVVRLTIDGMSCDSCARYIEREVTSRLADGSLLKIEVEFPTKEARFTFLSDEVHDEATLRRTAEELVTSLGYRCGYVDNGVQDISRAPAEVVCSPSPGPSSAPLPIVVHYDKGKIQAVVDGMSCSSCAMHLESAAVKHFSSGGSLRVFSLDSVSVNFATKQATFHIKSSNLSPSSLDEARSTIQRFIEDAGYQVLCCTASSDNSKEVTEPLHTNTVNVSMIIDGMSCSSCSAHIESKLKEAFPLDGDKEQQAPYRAIKMSINFATKQLHAEFLSSTPSNELAIANRVAEVVQSLGYRTSGVRAVLMQKSGTATTPAKWSVVKLLVEGMSCASCAANIEKHVTEYLLNEGATPCNATCAVNYTTGLATIRLDQDADPAAAFQIVADAVRKIIDMGYSCRVLGVSLTGASSPLASSAAVTLEDSSVAATRRALERTREIATQRQRFLWSLLFTLPLDIEMIVTMASKSMSWNSEVHREDRGLWLHLAELVLATPVVLFFGRQFFVKAWSGLKHRTFTMDTLVAVGVGSAYLFSLVSLVICICNGVVLTVYFDAAATLTTFMLLGRYLEAKAKRHTSDALIQLMSLVPQVATVVVVTDDAKDAKDNHGWLSSARTLQIPTNMIQPGQRLRVLAGDRLPCDGVVAYGESDVDEQLVTGESLPRQVAPGDAVTGGTLNETATLYIDATRVGEETTIAHILKIVQDAQAGKPAIQRIADTIAGIFVPCVMSFALLVLVTWMLLGRLDAYPSAWHEGESYFVFAFSFFVATIVVACPCALGLATPTAVMVGTGVGARHGVLIKSGAILEVASNIDTVVFDKTGTLTEGKLSVTRYEVFGAAAGGLLTAAMMRDAVAAIEEHSKHPIARAIVSFSRENDKVTSAPECSITVQESQVHAGFGMSGVVRVSVKDGADRIVSIVVGSLKMFSSTAWSDKKGSTIVEAPSETFVKCATEWMEAGCITVAVAVDGVPCCLFGLSDSPKTNASTVVLYLQQQGYRVLMVTGDHMRVATHVGAMVGITSTENIFAEVLPQGKASIVKQLQSEGRKVAFVGDGINDSPALAQADVGIALGAGTEIAMDTADAVLMHSNLEDICTLFALSITTMRRIKMNMCWAFGYNFVMLPMASGAFYPWLHVQMSPVIAGIAMVCSSLSVLGSSLLLRCFSPPQLNQEIESWSGRLLRSLPWKRRYRFDRASESERNRLLSVQQ